MERDKREPYEKWLGKEHNKENAKLKRQLRKRRYDKLMARVKK